jgi:hypothetical protein
MMNGEGLLDPSPNTSPSSCVPAAASTRREEGAEGISAGGDVDVETLASLSR